MTRREAVFGALAVIAGWYGWQHVQRRKGCGDPPQDIEIGTRDHESVACGRAIVVLGEGIDPLPVQVTCKADGSVTNVVLHGYRGYEAGCGLRIQRMNVREDSMRRYTKLRVTW